MDKSIGTAVTASTLLERLFNEFLCEFLPVQLVEHGQSSSHRSVEDEAGKINRLDNKYINMVIV